MAVALAFSIDGVGRAEQRLKDIAGGLADRQPLMESLGLYLESSTIDRFDEGVGPDGTPWKPSGRVKATAVGEVGPQQMTGKTLIRDGHLRGSISYDASNDQVEWGSNLIYARPHQKGAKIEAKDGGLLKFQLPGGLGWRSALSVTIPARPYLGVNDEDELQIIGIAEDYVADLDPDIAS